MKLSLAVAKVLACAVIIGTECPDAQITPTDDFTAYWNQGNAEITSYKLTQARYGELREGHAVLVFVTEDFSREKQVKLDNYETAGADRQKVLKLNLVKKFTTGIYPYSLMTSVFMPVESGTEPAAVKVTTSSQEWCGNTFMQLNLGTEGYVGKGFSYFESEGDRTFTLPLTYLEDEIWTRIRMRPETLPIGELDMVPGTLFQRLSHVDPAVQHVVAERTNSDGRVTYRLTYPALDRTLAVTFEDTFPYRIVDWTETGMSGFGSERRELTTVAVRDTTIMLDYWNHNSNADESYRRLLHLE